MSTSVDALKHLFRLTDDTGIMEHACGIVPRRQEGYSTDDQARALWVCLEWLDIVSERESGRIYALIDKYLSFMLWAQTEDGHFHNNFAYDRSREAESPSEDCLSRCLWACARLMVRLPDTNRFIAAETMLRQARKYIAGMNSPRGCAYALASFSLLAKHRYPVDYESEVAALANKLVSHYRRHAREDWHWYEPAATYSNGLLPWGLLCAYEVTPNRQWLDVAVESLDFLIRLMTNERGQIRPIGNRGWCTREGRAKWDQQPIDVMKLGLAAAKAYEIVGRSQYYDAAAKCRAWFHGDNDARTAMVDPKTGGCYDGIGERGVNYNQGAEAVISYLLTEAIMMKLTHSGDEAKEHASCVGAKF
ncbi:glycosyl transferase [Paenibacillus residui]|uniref:Glycosyl transferase n=1 Tax=Paenibacillus residui TaxID=629724 RepID=A0ABW3DIE0_9BACL